MNRKELLQLNRQLREDCLLYFADSHKSSKLKILLHVPSNGAVKYLLENWLLSLEHMGVQVRALPWGSNTARVFEDFMPNVFITVAHDAYLRQLDFDFVKKYKAYHGLYVGGIVDNSRSIPSFDFYIKWDIPTENRKNERHLEKPCLLVPFACNPLIHYMRNVQETDTWFFCGTNSRAKEKETRKFLLPIIESHRKHMILAGVGWENLGVRTYGELSIYSVPKYYSTSRISLNYHRNFQLNEFNEVNERTYIIPACGGFQITDNPKAMRELFGVNEVIACSDPDQYRRSFLHFWNNPEERYLYIGNAMEKAFKNYTYFHSLTPLLDFLAIKTGGKIGNRTASRIL